MSEAALANGTGSDSSSNTATIEYAVDVKGSEESPQFVINGQTFTVGEDGQLEGDDFGGINVPNGKVTGGTFKDGVLALTYELTDSAEHGKQTVGHEGENPKDRVHEQIALDVKVVIDGRYASTDAEVKLTILDDAPMLADEERMAGTFNDADKTFTGELGRFGVDGSAANEAVRFGKLDAYGNFDRAAMQEWIDNTLNFQWNTGYEIVNGVEVINWVKFDLSDDGRTLIGKVNGAGPVVAILEAHDDGNQATWTSRQFVELNDTITRTVEHSELRTQGAINQGTHLHGGRPTVLYMDADGNITRDPSAALFTFTGVGGDGRLNPAATRSYLINICF